MVKKQWAWIVLIVFALGTGECVAKEAGRYYNEEKGFSIKLPDGWEKMEGSNDMVGIMALGPRENTKDNFRENINVVIEKLPKPYFINEYFSFNLLNMGKFLTNFKKEEMGSTKLDGQDAKWLVYSHISNKRKLKVLVYFVIKGTKAYVITCTALPGTFLSYRAKFEETALSFKFYQSDLTTFLLNTDLCKEG